MNSVPAQTASQNTVSTGLTTRLVTVKAISSDGQTAVCVDRSAVEVRVPLAWQRAKGLLPAAGEHWVISQDVTNSWSFALCMSAYPTVATTGGTPDDPTLVTTDIGAFATVYGTDWGASGSGISGVFFQLQATGWVSVLIDVHTTGASPSTEICALPEAYVPRQSVAAGSLIPANGGTAYVPVAFAAGTLAVSGIPNTGGVRYAGQMSYPLAALP